MFIYAYKVNVVNENTFDVEEVYGFSAADSYVSAVKNISTYYSEELLESIEIYPIGNEDGIVEVENEETYNNVINGD